MEVLNTEIIAPHSKYCSSHWYSEIAKYLTTGTLPNLRMTKVQQASFLRRASHFKVQGKERSLFIVQQGVLKRCVLKNEVAPILLQAHDHGGHFASAVTIRKLSKYYWPAVAKDVRDYIAGCLVCAKHGTAVRSQSLAKVMVDSPMELLGIDFVGPFPKFEGVEVFYILVIVDYFSRYIWTRATKTDNSETVIGVLNELFIENGVPVGIYAGSGAHFGKATQRFAESNGVVWCTSPVSAKKATGMVEKAVDILQRALKKNTRDPSKWPSVLQKSHEILKGFVPDGPLEAMFPSHHRESLKSSLKDDTPYVFPENDDVHGDMVIRFVTRREEIRRRSLMKSDDRKERVRQRHDLGVRVGHNFTPGQLIMLWDEKTAGKKLRAAWRGPFIVTGFGGDMGKSYTLRQVDGSLIPRHYYGDHLKPFRLREGYLVTQEEEKIPVYQNIRLGNAAFKLPKTVQEVRGAHLV